MPSQSFQDLQVWQRAIFNAEVVYNLSKKLPEEERFGIQSQIRRAVVSISSNIAEGHSRRSKADFARFVRIALGSCRETQSLLILCERLWKIDSCQEVVADLEEIAQMLFGLLKHLAKED